MVGGGVGSGGGGWCGENDSKVFVSLSALKLFVRIEVIAATRALGGLVSPLDNLLSVVFSFISGEA